jgi:hypothetical protein
MGVSFLGWVISPHLPKMAAKKKGKKEKEGDGGSGGGGGIKLFFFLFRNQKRGRSPNPRILSSIFFCFIIQVKMADMTEKMERMYLICALNEGKPSLTRSWEKIKSWPKLKLASTMTRYFCF